MKAVAFISCCIMENNYLSVFTFNFSVVLYNSKFLTNLYEGCNSLVKVLLLVGCRELYANTCLALWNYRIVETGNEDTLLGHFLREYL